MPDDPERSPYDHRRPDDVRSAFDGLDGLSPGLGDDELPLTRGTCS
jgi:hypothetical protein